MGLAVGLGVALVIGFMRRPLKPPPGQGAPIQDVLRHHADGLRLDRSTLDQAWAIANGAREELDGYRASIRQAKEELERILDADEVDRERMRSVIAKIGTMESELRTRELEVMLQIRALLTPEQVEALKTLAPPPPPRRAK
ncbi:MAG: periplasmic heavy metal sensor [Myxococcota bacterium]